jgi:hypothetical protein
MAKRLSAGTVSKDVADIIHEHDDRLDELEKAVTALVKSVLGETEEPAADAEPETPAEETEKAPAKTTRSRKATDTPAE